MTDGRDEEPFEQTTRPAAYVSRPETEQVLGRLQAWARDGGTASIGLTGAAGMGKSLLLRVLAERTAGQPAAVHVPYPNLMPGDLASWVLEAIGVQRDRDSQTQLVAIAKQCAASGGMVLLIDDAENLPTQTRDALDHWFRRSESNLRSVRATVGVSTAAEDAVRDECEGEKPALTQELDVEQSTALLTAAMDRAGLHGPLRARFNHAVMLQLHDRARGVPARLLNEASLLYRKWIAGAAPPIPTRAGEDPSRAPTQRSLAQLELALAADPNPATQHQATPPPIPRDRGEQMAPGSWESHSSQSEPAWVSLPWIAAAGAAAVLLAVASTLLPTTLDGDATVVDAAVSEPPPVSAAPAPLPPSVAPANPVADAGIGSIEFLETIPAAPEPAAELAAPVRTPVRAPIRTPDRTPAEIAPPADAGNVVVEGVIEPAGWLASSFRRRNIPDELASLIAREMGDAYDFRQSQPGDRYRVTRNRAGELVAFDYEAKGSDVLELRLRDGHYELRRSNSR